LLVLKNCHPSKHASLSPNIVLPQGLRKYCREVYLETHRSQVKGKS